MSAREEPVRRRLDLIAKRQAGGDIEFLSATLVDDGDQERTYAIDLCELPAPDLRLGETGLTVEDFLAHWRNGLPGVDAAARAYGRALYRSLFEERTELREAWSQALQQAAEHRCGLRLEIRCPLDAASHWRGQPLPALPFELLCDDTGFLFRRPGWTTIRRSRGLKSRSLRLQREHARQPCVQVAWANVPRPACEPMSEALFSAHDAAVAELAGAGRADRLAPIPGATRRKLAQALEHEHPHVLMWIGHGFASGSGLLLHAADDPAYPADTGTEVSATDFAATVREGQVDVVLLWSCHGAGTFRALDVGVAEALLDPARGDVAAVLAAFSALDAQAVVRLSKELIQAWAHGDGDFERALARARSQLDELSLTWARPVLFLRTPPGDPGPQLLPPALAAPPLQQAPPDRLRWVPALPPHTAQYVDRQQRVARVREDLKHHPIVVLEGLPGVGKTELALALAHEWRSGGNDVAFVDLSGQRSLGPLRQTLGLLVSATPYEQDAALLADLAGRRWTLVLDNAEDLLTDGALHRELLALLADLKATGPAFRALVTSRRALAKAGSTDAAALFSRELSLLDEGESFELFVAAAGPRLAPGQASREVLDPLLRELGGIARAIVLMAGQLGGEVDVAELRRRLLAEGASAIVEEDLVGEVIPPALDRRLSKSSLTSALSLSLASAARDAASASVLFDALGTFPGGLLQMLLPRGSGTELGDALAALLDHHLVQLVGDERRIVMAAPVRAWARRRRTHGDEVAAAALLDTIHRRLAGYCSALDADLGTARAQVARLRFLLEVANVAQAIEMRARAAWAPPDDLVAASLFRSSALFAVHGATARATLATLEPLVAPMLVRPPCAASAQVGFHLGQLKMRTDDLAGARKAYEEALPLYRQIEARLGEANTLQALGDLKMRTDDLAGARKAYEEALPLYRQIEYRLGEANTLQSIGQLELAEHQPQLAFTATAQALDIQVQIDDRLGRGGTHGYLARIAADVGAIDLAAAHGARALRILSEVQDRFGQMLALIDLGQVLLRKDAQTGAACLLQAQSLAAAIGDPNAEGLGSFIDGLRPDDVSVADFGAALDEMRAQAPQAVDALCEAMEAAVASGAIDLGKLPPGASTSDADGP